MKVGRFAILSGEFLDTHPEDVQNISSGGAFRSGISKYDLFSVESRMTPLKKLLFRQNNQNIWRNCAHCNRICSGSPSQNDLFEVESRMVRIVISGFKVCEHEGNNRNYIPIKAAISDLLEKISDGFKSDGFVRTQLTCY
jgi:hypothetical protein